MGKNMKNVPADFTRKYEEMKVFVFFEKIIEESYYFFTYGQG